MSPSSPPLPDAVDRPAQPWIYVFPEGEMFIAACHYFDIVTQGKTRQEAIERFYKTFTFEVMLRVDEKTGKVKDMPPPPPPAVLADWRMRSGYIDS